MKKIGVFCFFLFLFSKTSLSQLSGTIHFELNYHIPEQGRRAMEKSGFAVTTGMDIEGNGSALNVKILSDKNVKMEILYSSAFTGYVDRPNRKAYKMQEKSNGSTTIKPTVTKTDEYETILGHKCRKYIVEHDGGIKQFVWACPDYKVAYDLYEHISGNKTEDESFAKEIEGVPFRITSGNDKSSFEMNVKSISDSMPDGTEFSLPNDFVILPYDPVAIGKMLMGEQ